MPEPTNPPAGADAGKPASGSPAPAAEAEAGAEDRQALRTRAIDAERKLAKLDAEVKKADEKRLAEAGEHQKLASIKSQEADQYKAKWISERRSNALIAAGHKAGVRDVSDLVLARLPDDLDIEDSEALRGAAESAIGDLSKAKPYLFGHPNPKTETATTKPAIPGGTNTAKLSGPVRSANEVHAMTSDQKKQLVSEVYGNGALGGGFFRK